MKRVLMASVFVVMAVPAMPAMAQNTVGAGINIPAGVNSANVQDGANSAISGSGNSESRSRATGGAGGSGGFGGTGGTATSSSGSSRAAGGSANGQVSNSNTFNTNNPSTIRNTPSVALGMATAYCQNSAGIGGSGPGFSFQALMGRHDADCVRYNYALALQAMGEQEAALLVMANNKEVNAAITESRNRRNAAAMAPVVPVQPVGMNAATARDPRPSAAQCARIRRLADPTQVQRDFVAANCNG